MLEPDEGDEADTVRLAVELVLIMVSRATKRPIVTMRWVEGPAVRSDGGTRTSDAC